MPDDSASSHPPPSPLQPPLKSFGGYEIEGELGRGGMGVVYLARQVELNRRVALKMLTGHYGPDELQRFLEEAETAAGLNHTNIAHIYEIGEHDGAPFFSMEYVEAGSLADRLRKELPPAREAAQLLINIARALHVAHQNGVVHRDMKPANVLLDPDGTPKITDFGIAKRLKDDTKLTRTGAVMGTPTYMAPEQAKGDSRHVGPAADIYSLGAILYEMLAGRPPFLPEDSETAITVRVLTEDPVSPAYYRPEIPRDLETVCMKCLEKEPRDRYVSAAALAEDLRRFLDDESILAKPPNTVVNSIKWLRRNPWKFVASAVALLLIVAGVARLAQWEFYQRQRLEYAARVDWVNGGLEPLEKISEGEASRRATYLRLTRRGRFGPIAKVEVLNARGYPAVLRLIDNEEMIPLYVQGLTGAQPYAERLPESTAVEFLYDDNNNVLEATSHDRNGQVNWRIIYDRPNASGFPGRAAGARFVNLRGFDASPNVASHMEFERDAKGRDVKITFFDASGQPANNGEGVYGYKLERDDSGRITQLVNLGRDAQPTANRIGLIAINMSWGKELRAEMRDAKGQPTLWNGFASTLTEYDSAGNFVRLSCFGLDGKLTQEKAAQWSVQEIKRNEHGELTQRTYFKPDASGELKQVSQINVNYDDFGHPSHIQSLVGATSTHTVLQFDSNGNIIEEKFLDGQGNLILNDKGYAIRRRTYTSGAQGLRVEETYFDAAGKKTYINAGYHRLITEFNTTVTLRRQTGDEYDPAQYKYHRIVSEPEYDPQGRPRHSVTRYEDAQGNLAATGAGLPYNVVEEFFDERGRLTTEWKTGLDPKIFGGPVVRSEMEWHSNGKTKRRVRQVCDENRQPLASIANGSAARFEEEFDSTERRERIFETGLNEELLGYSTREAKFSEGTLQSVTHTRGDGTVLKSVRVFIVDVVPPADQPKAAELKVGDQFVAANGKPVTSAYAWILSTNFQGGSIEVLREGQRIRIDGFGPGKLGVDLQDRAPAE